jgi:hypothetical protein
VGKLPVRTQRGVQIGKNLYPNRLALIGGLLKESLKAWGVHV